MTTILDGLLEVSIHDDLTEAKKVLYLSLTNLLLDRIGVMVNLNVKVLLNSMVSVETKTENSRLENLLLLVYVHRLNFHNYLLLLDEDCPF